MLIFISNEPRTYAWGSTDALPEILRKTPTGEPQAELWLGDHEGYPAKIAGARNEALTLIDLIDQAPEVYGVNGGPLPFLLKVLGIGKPLSLQVHPNLAQAKAGFEAENQQGIAHDDPCRSYKDANHKPELLVALTEVKALAGFRPLEDVQRDLQALAVAAEDLAEVADGLRELEGLITHQNLEAAPETIREAMLDWIFSKSAAVTEALESVTLALNSPDIELETLRLDVTQKLLAEYPHDPGTLVSLMMHIVEVQPGEALYVDAGELHAYLCGVAVEVMASSDNVLRAGLTPKHVDVEKLRAILTLSESDGTLFAPTHKAPGLTSWEPPIKDFSLHRALIAPGDEAFEEGIKGAAPTVKFDVPAPVVLLVTHGQLRVERLGADPHEVANVRQGQSLYISSGGTIELSGMGDAYLATIG